VPSTWSWRGRTELYKKTREEAAGDVPARLGGREMVVMGGGRANVVWGMGLDEVGDWLESLELAELRGVFKEQQVTGRSLVELWELLEADPALFYRLVRDELQIRRVGDALTLVLSLAAWVWCGVVWCGVVWCGVVWCGVVWCGV